MSNHIFIDACYSKPTSKTPVWFMRQAGRYMKEYQKIREKYNILDIARTPELAAEVTLQPIRAFSFDAAILFADIVLPLAPIGIDVTIKDGIGPIIKNPVTSMKDVKSLKLLNWKKDFEYLEKTIKILRHELGGQVPLIGFSGAPFTLAGYIIEGAPSRTFTKTKTMMYKQPILWHELMNTLTETVISYLKGQVAAGVEAVQIFDSWAGALSPADYRTLFCRTQKKYLDL
jgi:uroporphyrinogen decarboxylase